MSAEIAPTDLRTEDPRLPAQQDRLKADARRAVAGRLGGSGEDVLDMLGLAVTS